MNILLCLNIRPGFHALTMEDPNAPDGGYVWRWQHDRGEDLCSFIADTPAVFPWRVAVDAIAIIRGVSKPTPKFLRSHNEH